MTDLSLLIELIKQGQWPMVAAIVIGLIVRLVKDGRLPLDVPPRYRPGLALVLGVLSGAIEMVAQGRPWAEALFGGVISAAIATLGHGVIIEGFRGGRELGAEKEKS
jgi:hypothetical protein